MKDEAESRLEVLPENEEEYLDSETTECHEDKIDAYIESYMVALEKCLDIKCIIEAGFLQE